MCYYSRRPIRYGLGKTLTSGDMSYRYDHTGRATPGVSPKACLTLKKTPDKYVSNPDMSLPS
jgi:hypothetical protein